MPRRRLTLLERQVLPHRGVWSEDLAKLLGRDVFDVRDARSSLGLCPQTGDPAADEIVVRAAAAERAERADAEFQSLDALMRTNRSVCG
jgi:hypothetical protein